MDLFFIRSWDGKRIIKETFTDLDIARKRIETDKLKCARRKIPHEYIEKFPYHIVRFNERYADCFLLGEKALRYRQPKSVQEKCESRLRFLSNINYDKRNSPTN